MSSEAPGRGGRAGVFCVVAAVPITVSAQTDLARQKNHNKRAILNASAIADEPTPACADPVTLSSSKS